DAQDAHCRWPALLPLVFLIALQQCKSHAGCACKRPTMTQERRLQRVTGERPGRWFPCGCGIGQAAARMAAASESPRRCWSEWQAKSELSRASGGGAGETQGWLAWSMAPCGTLWQRDGRIIVACELSRGYHAIQQFQP